MNIQKIVGVVVAILVLLVMLEAFDNFMMTQVEEEGESLREQLQQISRFVVIDGEINEEVSAENAEKQFRGVMAGNFLMGQQCLYITMLYHEDDFSEVVSDNHGDEYHGSDLENLDLSHANVDELEQVDDQEFAFRGFQENLLQTSIDHTEFEGQCMGTEPIDPVFSFSPVSAFMSNVVGAVTGIGRDDSQLRDWEGFTAQGLYGEVNFEIEQSFTIDDPGLLMMDLGDVGHYDESIIHENIPFIREAEPSPDFVVSRRAASFFPEGTLPPDHDLDDEDLNELFYDFESYDQPMLDYRDHEEMDELEQQAYASRIRMRRVPLVAKDSFSMSELAADGDVGGQLDYLQENTKWVFCEGMEGSIQTNAGHPEAPGKQYSGEGQEPVPRDVPYPRVEVDPVSVEENVDLDECLEENGFDVSPDGHDTRHLLEAQGEGLPAPRWLDTHVIIPNP